MLLEKQPQETAALQHMLAQFCHEVIPRLTLLGEAWAQDAGGSCTKYGLGRVRTVSRRTVSCVCVRSGVCTVWSLLMLYAQLECVENSRIYSRNKLFGHWNPILELGD